MTDEQMLQSWERIVSNAMSLRADWIRSMTESKIDVDEECDYPRGSLASGYDSNRYQDLFDREPVANRVVQVMPRECWQVNPHVKETEDTASTTEFEEAFQSLNQQLTGGNSWHQDEQSSLLWEYLCRLDIQSGIGTFGLLLLGLDDGKNLQDPADGCPPDGNPYQSGVVKDIYGGMVSYANSLIGTDSQYTGVQFSPAQPAKPTPAERKLLFLRVFPESLCQVVQYESDIQNPRFGAPVMYLITLNDPRQPHSGVGLPLATLRVHWSRVIHVADNLNSSEIFASPRMRPVINRLLDIRKVSGSSAAGYWKTCFTGLSLETVPQLGGDVNIDIDSIRKMMYDYQFGLQKYLTLMGMSAKTLAPSVLDPTPHVMMHIQQICIQLGIPQRVFMGSERGELASSQDDASWNDRLAHRQRNYLTPRVVVPFVDRLIMLGVLPEPEQYKVVWPDLDSLTDTDKANIANTKATALSTYVSGQVETIITPKDFMVEFMDMDPDTVDEMLENTQDHADEMQTVPAVGEEGNPSTPPPKPEPPMPNGAEPPVKGNTPVKNADVVALVVDKLGKLGEDLLELKALVANMVAPAPTPAPTSVPVNNERAAQFHELVIANAKNTPPVFSAQRAMVVAGNFMAGHGLAKHALIVDMLAMNEGDTVFVTNDETLIADNDDVKAVWVADNKIAANWVQQEADRLKLNVAYQFSEVPNILEADHALLAKRAFIMGVAS